MPAVVILTITCNFLRVIMSLPGATYAVGHHPVFRTKRCGSSAEFVCEELKVRAELSGYERRFVTLCKSRSYQSDGRATASVSLTRAPSVLTHEAASRSA